jgi:lipopolysaccharide export system permease protein
MLKTLDRYIIKKFLTTLLFSILIFSIISLAIDFSEKVKYFLERGCTVGEILLDYYPGFIFNMSGMLMPLYTLIAVVFFTSRMAFNAELLSILNAGVSFQRMLRPYLIGGVIIAGTHYMLNHYWIPAGNQRRLNFERTYIHLKSDKGKTANVHMFVAPNKKVYVQGYNKENEIASGLRLEQYDGNKLVSMLDAQVARWGGDSLGGRWTLSNYSIREFNGTQETYRKYNTTIDTFINLSPEDFKWFENQMQEMSTPQLKKAIAREQSRGLPSSRLYVIERYRRTADAFTNIILTVIGLAVAGRKVRGGMGLHLALAVSIGGLFVFLSKFAVTFAMAGGLPIAIGMWLPNLLFAGVAVWLASRAQK